MRMVSVVVKPAKDSNHPGAQELCSKAASKTIGAKPPKQQKPWLCKKLVRSVDFKVYLILCFEKGKGKF